MNSIYLNIINRSIRDLQQVQHIRNLASFKNIFGRSKKDDKGKKEEKSLKKLDEFDENDKVVQKYEFDSLVGKSVSRLVRRKAYKPGNNVDDLIKNICKKEFEKQFDEKNYLNLSFDDPSIKFRVLATCITSFNHDISNMKLNDIKNVSDLVNYYKTEQTDNNTLEDIAQKPDLPKNMHVILEYQRFEPKKDTFFNGLDAYPDHDTISTSLWYSKKYKSIVKKKEYFSK